MADIDGRIAQGWGGAAPNGVHVNVILASRGSATAAAMTGAYASPSNGFTPVLVCAGPDQPSYETVYPPTIMLAKVAPATEWLETLVFGAAQVGTARAVLDSVAAGLLEPDQETLVFVSVWIDPAADSEPMILDAAREAVSRAIREAVTGRDPAAVRRLTGTRDEITHPFYNSH
ncbi:MAG TPA: formaldehyde-activating enzyme [Streptosporangiaceae bacterium]|nr:formaldehyde-activating enzyme [Streptosporangiaceae bacterium]